MAKDKKQGYLSFEAPKDLVSSIRTAAKSEERSVSGWLRHVARQALGSESGRVPEVNHD